ncbi:hypothetical protein [Agromyces badenianii]|uniref:hypothetical protein n=1 Tax=Agromyces badenianii TaxID=2080742 RepID=UPI000D59C930|nr:hypothetical protein [Agromyces badenianii]PWC04215.1 hypothetical protein DCE94_08650 [Agromyces badenianii]
MTSAKKPGTGKPPVLQRPALWTTIAVSALALIGIPSLLFLGLVHAWAAIAAPIPGPTSDVTSTTTPQMKPMPPSDETGSEQKMLDDLIDGCMAEKGYPPYLLAGWRAQDFTLPFALIPADEQPAFEYALWGDVAARATTSYEDYIANGGCDGYAIGQLYSWEDH